LGSYFKTCCEFGKFVTKIRIKLGVVVHIVIPVLTRDVKFKPSLVYTVSSRPASAVQRDLSKNKIDFMNNNDRGLNLGDSPKFTWCIHPLIHSFGKY
jgi:hypothetical protein